MDGSSSDFEPVGQPSDSLVAVPREVTATPSAYSIGVGAPYVQRIDTSAGRPVTVLPRQAILDVRSFPMVATLARMRNDYGTISVEIINEDASEGEKVDCWLACGTPSTLKGTSKVTLTMTPEQQKQETNEWNSTPDDQSSGEFNKAQKDYDSEVRKVRKAGGGEKGVKQINDKYDRIAEGILARLKARRQQSPWQTYSGRPNDAEHDFFAELAKKYGDQPLSTAENEACTDAASKEQPGNVKECEPECPCAKTTSEEIDLTCTASGDKVTITITCTLSISFLCEPLTKGGDGDGDGDGGGSGGGDGGGSGGGGGGGGKGKGTKPSTGEDEDPPLRGGGRKTKEPAVRDPT